jgi:hypothetical protein
MQASGSKLSMRTLRAEREATARDKSEIFSKMTAD